MIYPLALAVVLSPYIQQGYGNIVCSNRQYTMVDGKTIRCINCAKYPCKAGKEPNPPCGAVVGKYTKLGGCFLCKNGYHSEGEDVFACQPCKGLKCLKRHERVGGKCPRDGPDTSYCTGECEKGYFMNSDKTACELDNPSNSTDNPGNSTENPDDSTEKNGESGQSSNELLVIVLGSVLGVLVVVVFPVIGVCCWFYIQQHTQVTLKDQDSANASMELLKEEQNKLSQDTQIIKQEESQENNGQLVENKPHCPESSKGNVSTAPKSNGSVAVNMQPSQETSRKPLMPT